MKKILTILCCALSLSAFSQTYPEFAPVGAQWNYAEYNWGNINPVHIKSVAQDTIQGHYCKRLSSGIDVYRDSL